MTTIQRNYSDLIAKAEGAAVFNFSQFGSFWSGVDDKNPRAQDYLIDLLQTATTKLNTCIRLYRTWHTKESFEAKETLEHLQNVESLYKRTIETNCGRLYQFSRAALDLQPSDSLPALPICFQEAQENFQVLVEFLFREMDGEAIQTATERSSFGWREMVWQTVYPKYLGEILGAIDSLIHQEGFFTETNDVVEAKFFEIQERLKKAKDKKSLLEVETELKDLFALAFSKPPNGLGYGPGLNHRMKCLAKLEIPKRCEKFFAPLFQSIFAEQLKRIRQLVYSGIIPAFLMNTLKLAVDAASKPYRVEVGDFKAPDRST